MFKKWSKKFENCQQCGTKRFKHKAKGLCTRCYWLVGKLEQVNRWDLSDPNSLRGYPRELDYGPEVFLRVKSSAASQIRERLVVLREREEALEKRVDGSDLEYQLRRIAQRCRVKNKHLLFGSEAYFENCFGAKQRRILYGLLQEIEENIPWEGINWWRVSKDAYRDL